MYVFLTFILYKDKGCFVEVVSTFFIWKPPHYKILVLFPRLSSILLINCVRFASTQVLISLISYLITKNWILPVMQDRIWIEYWLQANVRRLCFPELIYTNDTAEGSKYQPKRVVIPWGSVELLENSKETSPGSLAGLKHHMLSFVLIENFAAKYCRVREHKTLQATPGNPQNLIWENIYMSKTQQAWSCSNR